MPNICENELYITGPMQHIKRFKKKAKSKAVVMPATANYPAEEPEEVDFKCSNLVPYPDDDTNLVEFYGTKWDCTGELLSEETDARKVDGELLYLIDSAWSPPLEWLRRVSEKFRKLRFDLKYVEHGMQFYGQAEAHNGDMYDYPGEDYEEAYPEQDEDCIS